MCGRFTLTIGDFAQLARLLGVDPSSIDPELAARHRPRYNVPPGDTHWIVAEDGARRLLPARWGYGKKKLPLARGETAPTQNLFRSAFASRRCLVPTTGFFEWTGEKGARKPHWFHPAPDEDELVLLGGIYGEGPEGFDFAILTTEANEIVRPVHDRMPVVVPIAKADQWLAADSNEVRQLIQPAPPTLLVDTAVSTRVNNARNDDAACLDALGDE